MNPIHQRLAELYILNKHRPLTTAEMADLQHSLHANANLCWKMAQLENWSLLASMVDDMEWLHAICAEICELTGQIKKPGHNATD